MAEIIQKLDAILAQESDAPLPALWTVWKLGGPDNRRVTFSRKLSAAEIAQVHRAAAARILRGIDIETALLDELRVLRGLDI